MPRPSSGSATTVHKADKHLTHSGSRVQLQHELDCIAGNGPDEHHPSTPRSSDRQPQPPSFTFPAAATVDGTSPSVSVSAPAAAAFLTQPHHHGSSPKAGMQLMEHSTSSATSAGDATTSPVPASSAQAPTAPPSTSSSPKPGLQEASAQAAGEEVSTHTLSAGQEASAQGATHAQHSVCELTLEAPTAASTDEAPGLHHAMQPPRAQQEAALTPGMQATTARCSAGNGEAECKPASASHAPAPAASMQQEQLQLLQQEIEGVQQERQLLMQQLRSVQLSLYRMSRWSERKAGSMQGSRLALMQRRLRDLHDQLHSKSRLCQLLQRLAAARQESLAARALGQRSDPRIHKVSAELEQFRVLQQQRQQPAGRGATPRSHRSQRRAVRSLPLTPSRLQMLQEHLSAPGNSSNSNSSGLDTPKSAQHHARIMGWLQSSQLLQGLSTSMSLPSSERPAVTDACSAIAAPRLAATGGNTAAVAHFQGGAAAAGSIVDQAPQARSDVVHHIQHQAQHQAQPVDPQHERLHLLQQLREVRVSLHRFNRWPARLCTSMRHSRSALLLSLQQRLLHVTDLLRLNAQQLAVQQAAECMAALSQQGSTISRSSSTAWQSADSGSVQDTPARQASADQSTGNMLPDGDQSAGIAPVAAASSADNAAAVPEDRPSSLTAISILASLGARLAALCTTPASMTAARQASIAAGEAIPDALVVMLVLRAALWPSKLAASLPSVLVLLALVFGVVACWLLKDHVSTFSSRLHSTAAYCAAWRKGAQQGQLQPRSPAAPADSSNSSRDSSTDGQMLNAEPFFESQALPQPGLRRQQGLQGRCVARVSHTAEDATATGGGDDERGGVRLGRCSRSSSSPTMQGHTLPSQQRAGYTAGATGGILPRSTAEHMAPSFFRPATRLETSDSDLDEAVAAAAAAARDRIELQCSTHTRVPADDPSSAATTTSATTAAAAAVAAAAAAAAAEPPSATVCSSPSSASTDRASWASDVGICLPSRVRYSRRPCRGLRDRYVASSRPAQLLPQPEAVFPTMPHTGAQQQQCSSLQLGMRSASRPLLLPTRAGPLLQAASPQSPCGASAVAAAARGLSQAPAATAHQIATRPPASSMQAPPQLPDQQKPCHGRLSMPAAAEQRSSRAAAVQQAAAAMPAQPHNRLADGSQFVFIPEDMPAPFTLATHSAACCTPSHGAQAAVLPSMTQPGGAAGQQAPSVTPSDIAQAAVTTRLSAVTVPNTCLSPAVMCAGDSAATVPTPSPARGTREEYTAAMAPNARRSVYKFPVDQLREVLSQTQRLVDRRQARTPARAASGAPLQGAADPAGGVVRAGLTSIQASAEASAEASPRAPASSSLAAAAPPGASLPTPPMHSSVSADVTDTTGSSSSQAGGAVPAVGTAAAAAAGEFSMMNAPSNPQTQQAASRRVAAAGSASAASSSRLEVPIASAAEDAGTPAATVTRSRGPSGDSQGPARAAPTHSSTRAQVTCATNNNSSSSSAVGAAAASTQHRAATSSGRHWHGFALPSPYSLQDLEIIIDSEYSSADGQVVTGAVDRLFILQARAAAVGLNLDLGMAWASSMHAEQTARRAAQHSASPDRAATAPHDGPGSNLGEVTRATSSSSSTRSTAVQGPRRQQEARRQQARAMFAPRQQMAVPRTQLDRLPRRTVQHCAAPGPDRGPVDGQGSNEAG